MYKGHKGSDSVDCDTCCATGPISELNNQGNEVRKIKKTHLENVLLYGEHDVV
jgi:hypothetical protein